MDYHFISNKWHQTKYGLLLLLGFQQIIITRGDQSKTDSLKPVIQGPDFVTVGVPSSVSCEADCQSCTYSMSLDGQSAQGQDNALAFTVNKYTEDLTVACSVTNEQGQKAMTSKKLQVLVGPVNVSISGPDLLNPSVSHTYSCHAHCRPSCSYSWKLGSGPWIKGQGNVLSVTPTEMDSSKILVCKATNTVSEMFVAATHVISVTVGPADMKIAGPEVLEVGVKATFVCSAACWPSCRFVSSVDSQSVRGNELELTVDHRLKSVTIKCDAQNTASRKSATTTKTVLMKDADRSAFIHLRANSTVLLLLVIFSMFTTL